MSDYSELKRLASLAKNWSGEIGEDDWYTACCFDKPKFSVLDAEFIAKCEPGSVLALIAEVESLREHKQLLVDLREADGYESWASVLVMVDKLKAKNEDLGKDAERYRWLMSDAVMNGTLGIFGGWIDFEFKDEASKQIDEAMQEVKP